MRLRQMLYSTVAAIGIAAFAAGVPVPASAQQAAVAIDNDDIGGVVRSANGPEAGVWVIAETTELPTKYAKMVVTDDQGRYVIPDLPKANYKRLGARLRARRFARRCDAKPGQQLNLTAVIAPNEAAAAQYYPAIYWYAMLKIPGQNQFGGKSNIPEKLTQSDWLKQMKNIGCIGCHQLGQESTRTIPAAVRRVRVRRGCLDAPHPVRPVRRADDQPARRQLRRRAVQISSAIGPTASPRASCRRASRRGRRASSAMSSSLRGSGATDKRYLHDLISSDRRNPTVNAYGPLYGSPEYSTDNMPILDPKTNKVTFFKMPVAGSRTCRNRSAPAMPPAASRWRRPPIGATRSSGTPGPTTTTPCSTRRAGFGSQRPCAAWTTRPSARRAPTIPRPRSSRSTSRRARWRCSIPRP